MHNKANELDLSFSNVREISCIVSKPLRNLPKACGDVILWFPSIATKTLATALRKEIKGTV